MRGLRGSDAKRGVGCSLPRLPRPTSDINSESALANEPINPEAGRRHGFGASGAMRDLVVNLLQLDDVNRFIGERMNGLFTRYDLGSHRDTSDG